jgi:hypothetical protein
LVARIEGMSLPSAAILAMLMQPWVLVAAGVADIAKAPLGSAASIVALVLFLLLASSALLTLQILAVRSPATARDRLDRLRHFLERNRDTVIVWLALIVGFYLIVKGAAGIV